MKVTLKIKKVDCANCAAKIEDKIKKISDLSDVNYNFMSEKLTFHCDETILKTVYPQIQKIVHMIEPDAEIERHEHHHEKHRQNPSAGVGRRAFCAGRQGADGRPRSAGGFGICCLPG